jgi:Uma2 family endonuclease
MTPAVAPAPPAAPYVPAVPAPAVAPPPPAALTPHRWTLDEYRELDKLDTFRDRKTMLLDGEIIDMPPPGPDHDLCLGLTQDWLQAAAPGHHVRVQMAFHVGTRTDPSPGLVVVAGARRD